MFNCWCDLFYVEMCNCRLVTWGQATIQVWDCDDIPSLHDFDRRNGSKQVKEDQKWRRMTKEWEKNIAKCAEIGT